jgi:hypothetical protein
LADIADYYADARCKFLVPDFSLLQGIAQALEPVFCMVGPDDAMHYQIGILLQKVAQEETTDESGYPSQQNLAKISRGHWIGRRSLTDRCMDESAQGIDVSLAMRWQRSNKRGHRGVGNGFFDHVSFP